MLPGLYKSDINKFWSYVCRKTPSECWLWVGGKTMKDGYGRFLLKDMQTVVSAHVFSWYIHNCFTDKPENRNGIRHIVLHSCDVKPCVNPSHLQLGTYAQNNIEKFARGLIDRHHGSANPNSILTEEQVHDIRVMLKLGHQQKTLAKQFGVSQQTISYINCRIGWK